MLFLVFFNGNSLHFLCIFIDLLVILDISLIYSAFLRSKIITIYQILRVCIGEALCKRVCIKVKRSVWVWWVWKCVWWISFSSRKSYRSWETWRHVSVRVCYSFLGVFVTFLVHFVFCSDYYVANFTLLRLLFRLKCTSELDASTSSRLLIIRNLKVQFQLVCFLLFSFCSVFMCALIDCKFTTLALFRVSVFVIVWLWWVRGKINQKT